MMTGFPLAPPGQCIGLFGGSFDPAHQGHVHVTREALKRFGLDEVWWLVSPGNPLKTEGPAPMARRMLRAHEVMQHPHVRITDLETRLGTRFTARTLKSLRARYPGVRFVWLMGADNFAQFHLWDDWRWIMENVAIGILARPGERIAARLGLAARRYRHLRVPGRMSHLIGSGRAPAWCFVNIPMMNLSSSLIRAAGKWDHQSVSAHAQP